MLKIVALVTRIKEPGVLYLIKFTSCLVCEVSASSKSDKNCALVSSVKQV